jgi:hypothetical protein
VTRQQYCDTRQQGKLFSFSAAQTVIAMPIFLSHKCLLNLSRFNLGKFFFRVNNLKDMTHQNKKASGSVSSRFRDLTIQI